MHGGLCMRPALPGLHVLLRVCPHPMDLGNPFSDFHSQRSLVDEERIDVLLLELTLNLRVDQDVSASAPEGSLHGRQSLSQDQPLSGPVDRIFGDAFYDLSQLAVL